MYERKRTPPSEALAVASQLLRHSLHGLLGRSARKRVGPIADYLEHDLTSLESKLALDPNPKGEDLSKLLSLRDRCDELYSEYSAPFQAEHPEEYEKVLATSVAQHPLYQHVIKRGGIGAKELFPTGTEEQSPVSAFLLRIHLSRQLFLFATTEAGLTEKQRRDSITRAIHFTPEYKQAGISILSYFSEIIDRRYPGHEVGIRIEQVGSRIALIIEMPSGEVDRIEQELSNYGLAVTGQMPLENYARDSTELIMLRTKLEISSMEVRQAHQILALERSHHGARIERLENELTFMRQAFERAYTDGQGLVTILRGICTTTSGATAEALERVLALLQSSDTADINALAHELRTLRAESPTIIDSIQELFLKGSIQGAAGNYLYAALQAIQRMA